METNSYAFNKALFSELLLKVKGPRTLTKFAKDTSTSIAHLSRMINQKLDSPPSPETLRKLISPDQGTVTYEELMVAAGYIQEDNSFKNINLLHDSSTVEEAGILNSNTDSKPFNNFMEKRNKFKSTCISTVLFNLSYCSYFSRIISEKDIELPSVDEFSLELIDSYISLWTFEVSYINPSILTSPNISIHLNRTILYTWGQLACRPLLPNTKYSILTDKEELYNAFVNFAPKNLDINLSIILVIPDELKVLEEIYLSFSHKADVEKMKKLLLVKK